MRCRLRFLDVRQDPGVRRAPGSGGSGGWRRDHAQEYRTMTTRSFALLLLPGFAGVAGAATAGEQATASCRVCGKAMANAHIGFIIERPDGRTERLGCANCGFAELRNLDEVAGVRTIDFLRGAEIDARDAFYVKGSSFTGCCELLPRLRRARGGRALRPRIRRHRAGLCCGPRCGPRPRQPLSRSPRRRWHAAATARS